jgi:leader peptidase (prepilin peptidase)/N-methyltransferase
VNVGPAVLLGLAGVPVGSFLNVVVERTPSRTPLRATVAGETHPPQSWLGVPVQPWLLRGARGAPRLRRWLAVELATAVVFASLAGRYGDTASILPLLVLGAGLVAASAVDLEHLRIPDRITFPTLALAVPAMVAVSLAHDNTGALRGAIVGSVGFFVLLLVPHLVYPRGMGFGDVKLAILMGLYLGWLGWKPDEQVIGPVRLVLDSLVLGCLLGVVFGLAHAAATRRRGEFPFGPALASACLVVAIWAA